MAMIEINGKEVELDEEAYLVNLSDWNKDIAVHLAKDDDLELSDAHWEVINFLREYYDDYQIAPAGRVLTKAIGKKLGRDKGNSKYLYELFPYGPAKQACRYAGLPKPTGCV
jgi:tRNA 2-thiouridine synthesizing protein E